MKIIIIIVIVVIVLAAVAVGIGLMLKGPDLSGYEVLKDPRISSLADRKVLAVTIRGEPDKVLPGAFKVLMQTYFKLKGVPRGPAQSAPALRCPRQAEGFAEQDFGSNPDWQGTVAIPVPDSITELPVSAKDAGPDVQLTTWAYGTVAEILHTGPYANEVATIKKLEDFIAARGYRITGEHEEEYLRGPGMPFIKPADYYTIIRYRIVKN